MELGHWVSDFGWVGSRQGVRPGVWPSFEF